MFLAVLSSTLLAIGPVATSAQTRFFLGGGPTGTSDFGFKGGWGGVLGFEHRIGDGGSFLVRAEGGAVPSSANDPFLGHADLGEAGPSSSDATLLSLMGGLRLGGSGGFRPYLDTLVGVGYMNDPANTTLAVIYPFSSGRRSSGNHANIALSVGPGVAIRPPYGPAWFADVHYDFFFVDGANTPAIPVRLGLMTP
jgi:hypothetical protein